MPSLITTKAAAEILGVDPTLVTRLIRAGKLTAVRLNREWRTSEQWVQEFIDRNIYPAKATADGISSPS